MENLKLNRENTSGLKEYNPPESLWEQYQIAKSNHSERSMMSVYGRISEAAENGDEEAIVTLAMIYHENNVPYGKKRNRILKYADSEKSNQMLGLIYCKGLSVGKDETVGESYYEKALEQGSTQVYKLKFIDSYKKDEMEEAWNYARQYITSCDDIKPLENIADALAVVMGERCKILDMHQKSDLSYIEQLVKNLIKKYKEPYVPGKERNKDKDRVVTEAVLLHANALVQYEKYKEALEVLLTEDLEGFRSALDIFKLRAHLDSSTKEQAYFTLWKRANDENYPIEYRTAGMKRVEFLIERYKKKSFFEYSRFVNLGIEAGCKNAESYAADVQNILRENAILAQALEVLQTSNYEMAITEIERLAEGGNKDANFEMGKIYEQGIKRPRNMEKANAYYEKAGRRWWKN